MAEIAALPRALVYIGTFIAPAVLNTHIYIYIYIYIMNQREKKAKKFNLILLMTEVIMSHIKSYHSYFLDYQ